MGIRYLYMDSRAMPMFITAGKTVFEPGEQHARRVFPAFVAMFILEGSVFFRENDIEYELKQGEWFIQTPGNLHEGYRSSGKKASYYWIHFLPEGEWEIRLQQEQIAAHDAYRLLDSGEGLRIPHYTYALPMRYGPYPIDLWRRELDELTGSVRGKNLLHTQSRFLKLLVSMVLLGAGQPQSSSAALAEKVRDYIQEHYRSALTIEEIAELVHFSPDYLSKCFRIRYGIPPSEYVTQLRMEQAMLQLIGTRRSIREIAAEVGYAELSVFSRAFTNAQGMSPSAFRNQAVQGTSSLKLIRQIEDG